MKYCPYCGIVINDSTVSFCENCGNRIDYKNCPDTENTIYYIPDYTLTPRCDISGYDGYYEDLFPIDFNERKDEIDYTLIKKIAAIIISLIAIVTVCILWLYSI